MSWSTKEKTFCVEAYFANKSYMVVQEILGDSFGVEMALSKSRIFEWVNKFREHGTVQNLNSTSRTVIAVGGRAPGQKETFDDAVKNWGSLDIL